ncbi:MAG: hypothetical protein ACK4XK_05875, partial [Casimicrobiaceae bacterium]
MKVLIVADVLPTANSGAAGTDYLGASALQFCGVDVDCIWGDQLSRMIRHYNSRYLLELPFAYRSAVVKALRNRHYDVVQVSQPHGYLAAKYVAKHKPETIFVHRSHGFESRVSDVLKPWIAKYAERRSV